MVLPAAFPRFLADRKWLRRINGHSLLVFIGAFLRNWVAFPNLAITTFSLELERWFSADGQRTRRHRRKRGSLRATVVKKRSFTNTHTHTSYELLTENMVLEYDTGRTVSRWERGSYLATPAEIWHIRVMRIVKRLIAHNGADAKIEALPAKQEKKLAGRLPRTFGRATGPW